MPEATGPAPLPDLLDITELAKHLRVNPRHIRRLVFERRIPFVKWGHLVRFDPDEIRTWINSNRTPTGGQQPYEPPPSQVRSLARRRPAQAEPSDSLPQQQRLDP